MSNIIETQFIVEKENILERSPYFYRFPNFNEHIIPIFLDVFAILSFLFLWNKKDFIIQLYLDHDYFRLILLGIVIILLIPFVFHRSFSEKYFLFVYKPLLAYEYKTSFYLNDQCITVKLFKDSKRKELNYEADFSHKMSFVYGFSIINNIKQSKHFIYLRHLKKFKWTHLLWERPTEVIFLKKDAITYADFQRLQEAIPCLQGLSVDPQQFKQETTKND